MSTNFQLIIVVFGVCTALANAFSCPTVCSPCANMTEVCPLPRLYSDDYRDACGCCPLCVTLIDEGNTCDQCEQSSEGSYQWIPPMMQCNPGLYCLCRPIPNSNPTHGEATTIPRTRDPSEQVTGICRKESEVPPEHRVTPNYPKWHQTSAPITSATQG